jgi:hypothetical protein
MKKQRAAAVLSLGLAALAALSLGAAPAEARARKKEPAEKTEAKAQPGKPNQVANFGDWGVFVVSGKAKVCYALAKPKTRAPATLKRDDAYIFLSTRPAENVKNEISIAMGYPMKDNSEPKAEIGSTHFELVAKGSNAWIKNQAQEGAFIDTMKKSGKLIVKASSAKGKASTDTYALSGLSDALARVQKECK